MLSLVDLLDRAVQRWPERRLDVVDGPSRTLPELWQAAAAFAGGGADRIAPGDRVLLLLQDIDDFFVAFWGCQFLGATAVPLAPPRGPGDLDRVRRVLDKTRGPVIVDRGLAAPVSALDLAELCAGPPRSPRPSAAPALVQFSSGSTGQPRGVLLSHDNLLHNARQIAALPLEAQDRIFVWMPHFHDMGLIGGHLTPLWVGMDQVRMDAGAAMRDPLRWLQEASRRACTVLTTTNFALDRANTRRAQAPGLALDLSAVRLVCNGAEPVSAEVCRRFSRLFSLPEAVHFPMYGLAEASVGVCCPRDGGLRTIRREGRELVSCGPPMPGIELRIAEGEIQLRGPNVCAGLLEDPEGAAALFQDGWLRTGDLGERVDGELYVTGRIKDLIALNGRKLQAHELEALAEAVPGVRAGGAVAISDRRGEVEGLVVLLALAEGARAAPVLAAVRRALAGEVEGARVLTIPAVPRTTSGKKRRAALREAWEAGELDRAHPDTLRRVASAFAAAAGRAMPLDRPLAEAGLGSIQAVDALARLGSELGLLLDHRLLRRSRDLAQLAWLLEQEEARPAAAPLRPPAEPPFITGMACRLPGAEDPLAFWADLAGPTRLGASPRHPGRVGGWLAEVDRFDAPSWGIPAEEAAVMDPQQRLLLTLAREALQDLPPEPSTGVFVGAGHAAYAGLVRARLDPGPSCQTLPPTTLPPTTLAGNLLSMLAGRLAFQLDLRGPALTVDTACSSALVALHLACRSLQAGECRRALVAAVHLDLDAQLHQLFALAGALSKSGRCLPFSPQADGTLLGEGALLFVLEPGDLARASGRPLLGRIRGTAVNNDGSSLGVMAPNPAGQEAVIAAALAAAGVGAEEIRFVEAHGTGTPIGDPVEDAVLRRAYPHGPRRGAVKGHLGHLMGAAGAAGLLRLLGELGPGELGAVSAFGFGGTNAHVIVEGGARPGPVVPAPRGERHWLGRSSPHGLLHEILPDPAGGLSFRPLRPPPEPWTGRRVLVTGGTGAIGRALVQQLLAEGARVVAVARSPAELPGAELVMGDVADPALALRLRAMGPFEVGFHLAGSLSDPMRAKAEGFVTLSALSVGAWVLASSISAVIPGLDRGIEAYAAANRALVEAAARAPGRVVAASLGPVAGAGLAAGRTEELRARGIPPLSMSQAVAGLLACAGSEARHVLVLERPPLVQAPLPEDLPGRVRALVARAAGRAEVDDHEALGSLGVDSVAALDLLKALEGLLGHALPTTLLYENDTIAKILAALEGAGRVEAAALPAGDGARGLPLLPSQRTFLVQSAYFPDMPGNVLLAVTVRPGLDRERLSRALDRVLERHPILGMVLVGQALQPGPPPVLEWVQALDLARISDQVFELSRGPLLRVLSDGRQLVLNGHHALVDAWSIKIVLEDLLASYEELPLAPLRAGFAEVVAASSAPDPGAVEAWRRRFADGVPALHLPWEAPVDAPSSGGVGTVRCLLDRDATAALQARAREAGVSLPALLLAAWLDRLYAWSGQPDLVVRVAHARREARVPDIDRIVGPFADGLPLRVFLRHGASLEELARQVQAELAFAQAHAGASSLALSGVGAQGPSGPVGLTPAGFSFPLLPAPERIGGLSLDEVHGAAGAGFTRLTLVAWLFRDQLHLALGHARSHLSAARTEALAAELLARLGPTPARPATLHGRILSRCRQHPERPAVGALSYGALARRSAALARRLPLGGAAGEARRFAVLGAQSPEVAVALMAVLRAGHAFVPLDPEWPDARIAQILASARPAGLLAGEDLAPRAAGFGLPLFVPDQQEAEDGPDEEADLAYLMYTSGSTGRPKGVVVGHAESLVFHEWIQHLLGVDAQDRFLGSSSLGYGGALRQIFTPLLYGGQSCPVPRAVARDPDALCAFVEAQGITVWNSVPSLWGHLLQAARRLGARFPALRWVLVGGEAVPAALVNEWRANFPGRVLNLYGSTETLINATAWEAVRPLPLDMASAPIGRARGGTTVALVEAADGEDLGEGVGEIVVGGAIARGYWDEPDLSAQAFVELPGLGRVYRTGDLGRRLPDGNLVFVGRRDSQVQVHGNRVELPEIEHAFCALPGVAAAAVLYEGGALVAFLVAAPGAALPDPKEALAQRLPAYMVPHRCVVLPELPRNPAGKLDRLALKARLVAVEPPPPDPETEAHGPAEALVAAAWQKVLGLARPPSPQDDFFALGGDSIRALEVLDQLRPHLAQELRPLDVYGARRLGALAALVQRRGATDTLPMVRARANPPSSSAPLSEVQRGFWTAQLRRPDQPPVWVARVPLSGPVDRGALEAGLARLVERHEMLRTAFADGRQQVLAQAELPLQFEDLEALADPEAALAARFEEELGARFRLDRPPLFRVRLCSLGPQAHVLLVSSHHIASDAWSLWVLARELLELHADRVAGRASRLAGPAPSFRALLADAPEDPWWRENLADLAQEAAPAGAGPRCSLRFALSPPELALLQGLARARAESLYVLVLAALFAALHEILGGEDRVVSTALSGRESGGGERGQVVGPFARGLPVRVRGRPQEAAVARAFREALAHSEASAASMAAGLGRDALERLGRFFLTWLDPSAVPMPEGPLRLDWPQARFRFATGATATEAFVSVLVDQGLQVSLHGGPLVETLAPALERRLRALLRPDAALIVYPPEGMVVPLSEPAVVEQVDCALGRSELVLIPALSGDLDAAVRAAAAVTRARVIALAGMLPARTGLGSRPLVGPDQVLTTGHAATVVAMVRTTEAALLATGRTWSQQRVGVLGYGSIGRAVLALLRHRLGEAAELRLQDPALPHGRSVLGCDLVLGASSVGGVLSVAALPPGTLVIDDSFPRAFDDGAALARMQGAGDVLLLGGGMLDAGPLDRRSPFPQATALRAQFPSRWLPGCHAEALLVASTPGLGPTVGPVDLARALAMDAAVTAAGWTAAPLHLGTWEVPASLLEGFRALSPSRPRR